MLGSILIHKAFLDHFETESSRVESLSSLYVVVQDVMHASIQCQQHKLRAKSGAVVGLSSFHLLSLVANDLINVLMNKKGFECRHYICNYLYI